MQDNKKVLLGMSGGVDSSVAAILLKEKGYELIGTTMELFPNSSCCNTETYNEAKKICKSLGFDHFILNFAKEFQKYVIDDFIDNYKNCSTPNPCIECNRHLKFGLMYEKAKELGCNYISTGHYAKTEYSEKYKRYVLKKSNNLKKDQTYVLYTIPKELIEHMIFPLGEFEDKEQVREIARKYNFSVASRPDSEDICFVPDGNYKDFLEKKANFKPREGNIVNTKGEVLGKHTGLYKYTIGQRKGMGIAYKEPLFVIGFNILKNELIVGTEQEQYKKEFIVKDINLLLFDEIKEPVECEVKIRYSAKSAKCTIYMQEDNTIKVIMEEPIKSVTKGQSAVFYIDDMVLGGGKIC
ncbi:MAG: tRNA 2-thiouridine(34) synthase MnmA [Clostridia bacterium]|nr:tRNA 2-thiouridine(34) synthase MnmA [Clostridia bacterium]